MRIGNVATTTAFYSKQNSGRVDSNKAERKSGMFQDGLSLSPFGRGISGANSQTQKFIKSLMEQKQNIMDSKNDLIARTLESGLSLDSIKEELKSYQEQLEAIDVQLTQTVMEAQKKAMEELQNKGEKVDANKPKTEEELQTEALNQVANLSNSLDSAKVISSVKNRLHGQANVLAAQIKLDGPDALSSSKTKLNELTAKVTDLSNQLAEKIATGVEQVSELNQPQNVEKIAESAVESDSVEANFNEAGASAIQTVQAESLDTYA